MRKIHVFILLVLLSACATNPVTGQRELMFLGKEEELRMGEQVYPSALWGELGGGGEYRDPQLEAYLSGIVNTIHSVSHRPEIPLDFVVQNSSVPNAWAIPGHTAMTRGLLAELENEAQFAFIMGHETGHVAARHSARQYTRQVLQGLALGGGAAFLPEKKQWLLGPAAIGSTLFLLRYSREDELQADRLGVEYMAEAGYRPSEAIEAHRELEDAVSEYRKRMGQETPEGNFLSELLSTHPRTQVRLETVEEAARKFDEVPLRGNGVNAEEFRRRIEPLKRVNRAYFHYDKALSALRREHLGLAEEELQRAFDIADNQAPFYNLRGLLLMAREKPGQAETSFKRALELYPDYQPALQSLGLLEYQRKNFGRAVEYLQQSTRVFPGSLPSHYLLGQSFMELSRFREAIPHLETVANAVPGNERIHGLLGISFDRVGDLRTAYGHYRAQVQVAPATDLGRLAAQRLREIELILQRR